MGESPPEELDGREDPVDKESLALASGALAELQ